MSEKLQQDFRIPNETFSKIMYLVDIASLHIQCN